MTIRDRDIRPVLKARLRALHVANGETRIIDEMAICQTRARADVAVVNGHFAGFEIKSDADRLDRLPQQVRYYDQIFDYACVVCAVRYAETVLRRLPDWWGVWVADTTADGIVMRVARGARLNPAPSAAARVALIWRDEMASVLLAHGAPPAVVRSPRRTLMGELLDRLDEETLAAEIRAALRARDGRTPERSRFARPRA